MKCNIICRFATKLSKDDMIERTSISKLSSLIENARKIAIVTHMKPDGDAMGSSLGLYHFLKRYTCAEVSIAINDRYPLNLAFMIDSQIENSISVYQEDKERVTAEITSSDLIFCLDFNAFHRTENLEGALRDAKGIKVLIDHHLSPETEPFEIVFSNTRSSSTCELLFEILKSLPQCDGKAENLPLATGEALMTGMTTDTNNFNNSVTPVTFAMASELIAIGVDRDKILYCLFNQFGENRLRLLGTMLKDLLTITDDGVAYMVLDAETLKKYNINEGDTEGFVNMPLSIKDVKMSLLLKEDQNRARVSIRSKKGVSANLCAQLYFNGGGHENAAGGRLYIPGDIADISKAGEYIEKFTHIFFTSDNEK